MNTIELLNNDFNEKVKADIFNCISIATKALSQFKIENRNFFNYGPKLKTLNGYLLTYAIERQLFNSSLTPTADYSIILKDVNKYKHKATFIRTNNFICNIGRTKKSDTLLPKSKYRAECAKMNYNVTGRQLILEPLQGTNKLEVRLPYHYHYAQISYLYLPEYDKLTHLDILVPNEDYSKVLYCINLLGSKETYGKYTNPIVEEEEIVKLKMNLQEEVHNLAQ